MNTGSSHPAANAAVSKAPPPPSVPPAEDQAGDGGESIATFANYRPTALPSSIVNILNGNNADSKPEKKASPVEAQVISLIDDDEDEIPPEVVVIDESGESSTSSEEESTLNKITCPSHTSLACESALLASVKAPPVSNEMAECLLDLAKTKALSPLQLESVLLAIQRHRRVFGGHTRAGFFIGDGAGVGKGRQVSAIIRDSLCRQDQTRRHLWFSVSRELVQDARRDLTDVGVHVDIHDGTELLDKTTGLGIPNKGVLFCTYQLLVSSKRMEQIVSWCAGTDPTKPKRLHPTLEKEFNGVIILDEAHKAKNLREDSKTAHLVIQIQRRLPNARVVYCSATGVSDVGHMVYAERLGLWRFQGSHDNFSLFESFPHFQRALEKRGLGSLELLALEMKQQGSFMARTLSWDGAEFETMQIPLSVQQQFVYDQAVEWWTLVKKSLEDAFKVPAIAQNPPNKMVWRIFWSCHQRFFKELAICSKIPYLAEDAKRMVAKGCCVLFGLQSTGDASMQSILEQNKDTERFPALLSTVAAVMTNFISSHFPVAPGRPEVPKVSELPSFASVEEQRRYLLLKREAERIQNMPDPQPLPELVATRQNLLNRIQTIQLPPNPLDDLIDRLGGVNNVSEMTGRPGRMVRSKNRFLYAKRGVEIDANDRINLVEKRKFMDGKKSYAIISDAASTGISLHAAQGSLSSHKRRIHYTIELPWSADKAVQQLGRSHRSAQESAPIYKLVVTDLGGERRFAAAVSKRMASLGALTKGDRRAATGADMLSDFDLDSRYGKRALKRFYNALSDVSTNAVNADDVHRPVMASKKSEDILDKFYHDRVNAKDHSIKKLSSILTLRRPQILSSVCKDLEDIGLGSDARKQSNDVKVFLNRIFGLPVARQNLVFSLFMSTLDDVVTEAKMTGEFEGTAEDIKATAIEVSAERVLVTDPSCGAETKLTTLLLDRGISLETVCAMAKEETLLINESEEADKGDTGPDEDMNTQDDGESEEKNADGKESEEAEGDDNDGEDDEDIEDDGWLSSRQLRRKIAEPGFYISRKKIAGRHLILFAKHKYPTRSFKNENEAAAFDPLGWMTVTRPNTGTNPNDMRTRDLNGKYRLALGSDRLKELLEKKERNRPSVDEGMDESADHPEEKGEIPLKNEGKALTRDDSSKIFTESLDTAGQDDKEEQQLTELINKENRFVVNLWEAAFKESNYFEHTNGLAPRRSKIGLVTGAVLHILPTLEKVVIYRSSKEQSLKIMRAEVPISPDTTRRLVGVRFPIDSDALAKLEVEMELLRNAQKAAGRAFLDETIKPICPRSSEWATTERKTMKSFFNVVKQAPSSKNTSTSLSFPNRSSISGKRSSGTLDSFKKSPSSSNKKGKNSIASFFQKK